MNRILEKTPSTPYPFHQFTTPLLTNTYVWLKINANQSKKTLLKRKIMYIGCDHSLNSYIMEITNIIQEKDALHLFYQYTPISFQTQSQDKSNHIRMKNQLKQFVELLVQNSIITQIDIANIGFSIKHQLKYYLELNFKVDPSFDKQKLSAQYQSQLQNIFQPLKLPQSDPDNSQIQIQISDYDSDLPMNQQPQIRYTENHIKKVQNSQYEITRPQSYERENKMNQRTQKLKQQQYKFILKSSSCFIKDFFQVLQEQPIKAQVRSAKSCQTIVKTSKNKEQVKETMVLQAKSAITKTKTTIQLIERMKQKLKRFF